MLEYESGHVLIEKPPCVRVCKVGAVARGVDRLIKVELDLDARHPLAKAVFNLAQHR